MPGDGKCVDCRATINGENCSPPVNPCENCGKCECLERRWMDDL